jgi:hypothetical protein
MAIRIAYLRAEYRPPGPLEYKAEGITTSRDLRYGIGFTYKFLDLLQQT